MKKLLALLLAVILVVGAALPAAASYKDVTDPELDAKLELLSALGVVNGYTDGTYRPAKTLTRAEFTKLVVTLLGKGEESVSYGDYTYFPDVRSGHWAAKYVNYAARVLGLVKGDGSGRFNADAAITYREAVTILLRALGYTDEMLGGRWPDNYFTKATALGLTSGITLGSTATVTRKDGAELFYNALYTNTKDGGQLIGTLAGGIRAGVLLLSVRATASDGTKDALLTAAGETIKTKAPFPTDYAGRRGTLVLDANGLAVGFIPEAQTVRTLLVSRTDSASVTGADGSYLRIPAATLVYFDGEVGETRWSDCWYKLDSGMALQVVLSASGAVDYLSVTTGAEENSTVLILDNVPTFASLCTLLGAPSDAVILKNGVLSTAGDLRRWDVAVYTAGTGVIRVTDFRLAAIYESADPSVYTPDKITVLCGVTFETLPSAASGIKEHLVGDNFTLLFTPDGKVAGVRSAGEVSGYQYGFYDGSAVHFPGGFTVPATLNREPGIVRFSQTTPGTLSAIPITLREGENTAAWNVDQMLLGDTPVSPEVLVVDRSGGNYSLVSLSEVRTGYVEASRILYVGKDSAGRVNLLVLDDVTGAGYLYAKVLGSEWLGQGSSMTGLTSDLGYSVSLLGGNTIHATQDLSQHRNTWCVISTRKVETYGMAVRSITPMEVHPGVKSGDFVSTGSVRIDGIGVPVSNQVQVLRSSTNTFLDTSGYSSLAVLLASIRNMGTSFTLCLDRAPSAGGMVRVIIID